MEKSFPFNAQIVNGVPDRVYAAEDFAAERAAYVSDGVAAAEALAVSQPSDGGMAVTVAPGAAVIDGYTYRNTAPLRLEIDEAGAAARTDLIVLRLDLGARAMHCAVKTGDGEDVPAVTVSASVHEIPLAEVTVPAGALGITAADVADRRVRAGYHLSPVGLGELTEEYAGRIEALFSTENAAQIAAAAARVRTDAGMNTVLCGDGEYRPASGTHRELARFDIGGTYEFLPSEYPAEGNLYDIVLVGGGGSGAHARLADGGLGGSAGEYVVRPMQILRPDVRCTVVVGTGGAAVTGAAGDRIGGEAGGASILRFSGGSVTAAGGAGGGIAGSAAYPPDTGPRAGSAAAGADSCLASGGAGCTGVSYGSGTDGQYGSGGGIGSGSGTSGAGGDGVVILYGIAQAGEQADE